MGKVESLDKARRARGKASGGKPGKSSARRRCPICGRPVEQRYRPFCSPRCAEVDLGRWIGGDYRIPGAPANALNSGQEEDEDEG
jgi:endogenous inhibitor of DNA gyrase (YacG/DUF329 family)